MKMTIKGFIQAHQYDWENKPTFDVYPMALDSHVQICETDISFELPENFSMEAFKLDLLNAEKEKVTVAFHARIAEINEAISKYQCLEMS